MKIEDLTPEQQHDLEIYGNTFVKDGKRVHPSEVSLDNCINPES